MTGPEKIAKVSGRPLVYEEIPDAEAEQAIGPERAIMFRWFADHGYIADLEGLKQFGLPILTFDQYLEKASWVRKL